VTRTARLALRVAAFGAALTFFPVAAQAQQTTFHLDRLEVPGAPDDGVAIFRPVTQQRTIVYGQLGIGYQLYPLRTSTVIDDAAVQKRSSHAVIDNHFALYGSAGAELLDRIIVGATFPMTLWQTGQNPDYGTPSITNPGQKTTNVTTDGAAVGDLRLDLRGVFWRSVDRQAAVGGQFSLFAPTGNGSRGNFGGDGSTSGMALVTAEYGFKSIIFTANTGVHFRPRNSINDPINASGIGVGNEWRWAVGAFVPLRDGKYRIGATIFGQTGIEKDTSIIGDTIFTKRNTPIEGDAEFRMKFGQSQQIWGGASLGTAILRGYGAPDLRAVLLAGVYMPIFETDAPSPQASLRDKWKSERRSSDRDNDGIPDEIDACPDEPEDHQGNDPNDGCPNPLDRDGDGIPDKLDACPDKPGQASPDPKKNGCPDDDRDKDGIPNAEDACPDDPGPPNADKAKNGCPLVKIEGGVFRLLDQIHFAFNSATILPDSFPLMQKIADIFNQTPAIKKVAIEGHTDNKGSAVYNKNLSQNRANSVMQWLVQHGVAANRLEAHGYGLEKPIADNNTEEGRAANRRVEFHILEEDKK